MRFLAWLRGWWRQEYKIMYTIHYSTGWRTQSDNPIWGFEFFDTKQEAIAFAKRFLAEHPDCDADAFGYSWRNFKP